MYTSDIYAEKVNPMTYILKGKDYTVCEIGGFLRITLDGDRLTLVSVPSPTFADSYRGTIVTHHSHFQDKDNNQYVMFVQSSSEGVDWEMKITGFRDADEKSLAARINVEYKPNAYGC